LQWENRNSWSLSKRAVPPPVRIDGVTTWDRLELDAAYERMKNEETEARRNPIEENYGIGAER
jgi:hypothetical protein